MPQTDRRRSTLGRRRVACLAALMLLWVPDTLYAGEVFGVVRLEGKLAAGGTLALSKPGDPRPLVNVKLGTGGEYSVFLTPGRYEARLIGSANAVTVHSFPARARQDLDFRR